MSTAADLRFYYASKYLSADGDPLTSRTVSAPVAGEERRQFTTALSEADDYWNGAIIRWVSTANGNDGEYSHVKDFANTSGEFTLYKDTPNDIATSDTFVLILGGKWRSGEEVPGMSGTAPQNVTGVTATYIGYENGVGNGTLAYNATTEEMTWTAPSGTVGPAVDVSPTGTNTYVLFDDDDSKWIEVSVEQSALPGAGTPSDTMALVVPSGVFIPDFEGEETLSGKTRYHLLVPRNINTTDKLYDVRTYVTKSVDNAADTTTTSAIGTGTETLSCTNLDNWPISGWIYNSDKDDIRYYYNRSGNNIRVYQRSGVLRGKTAVSWNSADNVELYPEFDIGLDAPDVGGDFEDPATETTAPSGVTFSTPLVIDDALTIGTIDAQSNYGVWIREVVEEATRARPNVISVVKFKLDVSGT